MKKILVAIAILVSSYSHAADPTVSEKVLKHFTSAFPDAEKVSWSHNSDSYEVAFFDNDIRCRMWYSEKGQITGVMRYYQAENLSPFILAKVQADFNGKKVFGVTEISTVEGLVYKIILEDDKNWYHISSDAAGNMTVEKKFEKA